MYFFSHRINSIKKLSEVASSVGVEIDIREKNSKLVLSHDPFSNDYIDLKEFLPYLKGRSIIANIKCERIEKYFLDLKNSLAPDSDYFFLDSSFSMIVSYGNKYNFASRFSEFESIETSNNLLKSSLINWLWIDTFNNFPINETNLRNINSLKIKKCLTSPDLLGRPEDIKKYAEIIKVYDFKLDAICCKNENISLWKEFLISH